MSTFEERAAQRKNWAGRLGTLADSQEIDLLSMTVEERLEELARLSLAAYALSGKPMPQYTRATMPGRLLALKDDE